MAKIIVAGATGLVGQELAAILAGSAHELHIIGRRAAENLFVGATQHIAPTPDWPDAIAQIGA